MKMQEFMTTMRSLVDGARTRRLDGDARYVFLSDLHMGNRTSRDDFRRNEELVLGALTEHYLPQSWKLVLNGDIEELHKFQPKDIRAAYPELYECFGRFRDKDGLVKIVGNHDLGLLLHDSGEFPLDHALKLDAADGSILAFHGHQSYKFFMKYNYLSDFIVRYIADPLKIQNGELPMTSKRRFKAERRIYRASKELGMITVAGHTHRPLFESYSKYDSLRWNIESLLRQYTHAQGEEKERIVSLIEIYAAEFKRLSKKEKKNKVSRSLYEREDLLVPCMFNSGCATAQGGFTAIEIEHGDISLVYWSKEGSVRPYIEREALFKDRPEGTPWQRYTLAKDSLEYVFARIKLLS
jgi:UDP-2,3-diacylglucosamine pyrophosphatase LpxH